MTYAIFFVFFFVFFFGGGEWLPYNSLKYTMKEPKTLF